MAYNNDLMSIFGLNTEQFIIYLSLQKLISEKDIEQSANNQIKRQWLKEWEEYNLNYISFRTSKEDCVLLDEVDVISAIDQLKASGMNMTWYYLVILELINFRPYFAWGNDSKNDQLYSKLKFKDQYKTIRELVTKNNLMEAQTLDKLTMSYVRKSSKLSNNTKKQLISFAVFGATVIAYYLSFISFMDVSIVMLVLFFVSYSSLFTTNMIKQSSSYHYLGSDLSDDILAIIGGGMLLGLLKGENDVDEPFIQASSSSVLALVQSSKLFTLIKVILIDLKGDNLTSNSVLNHLKEQMNILKNDIQNPNYDFEKYKVVLKHLQKSYSYMEAVYKDSMSIVSKFENEKYS